MKKTIENVIENNVNGLFLLDPPTGFGKTTAVLKIIKDFLQGDNVYKRIKRIFFITNLKTNLPIKELMEDEELTNEQKKQIFWAKSTIDSVLQNFLSVSITKFDIFNSSEYQELKNDIETYNSLNDSLNKDKENKYLRKSVKDFLSKIATSSEPNFRKLIRERYFFNKSSVEKNDFIKENLWFRKLYPICEIDKFKVIFLTTKKFAGPINIFKRMPFYIYNDSISDDSIVFIDEFDATKKILLKQIIDDGLIYQVDVVSLFTNIHLTLQSVRIPKMLYNITEYNQEKVEKGDWYSAEDHIEFNKKLFLEIYTKHNIQYILKNIELKYRKLFIFDDGNHFNIIKDSSKKFVYTKVNENSNQLELYASTFEIGNIQIKHIISDLEKCIDNFLKSLFYLANNYLYYKNSNKSSEETRYTLEESLYSVLDIFNLDRTSKEYLYSKIISRNFNLKKLETDIDCRKGFNLTEIEDSNYHDMKSIVHNFDFNNTPEDIILMLSEKSLVIGISATANIETCIGNYDLNYVKNKLKDNFIIMQNDDKLRIKNSFETMKQEFKGQYHINGKVIDNLNIFELKDKCEWYIKNLFKGTLLDKYLKILYNLNNDCYYHFLIELKLAFLYKEIGKNEIYSFIAFLNGFPKVNHKFDIARLRELFLDVAFEWNFQKFEDILLNSDNFDYEFERVKAILTKGEKVFVMTTYQTVGSGKNIQYSIPEMLKQNVLISKNDTKNNKDFDAIYLSTPTNLTQILKQNSEKPYEDLAKFLFEQEYLYKNNKINRYQMINNVVNAFRIVFFNEKHAQYNKNTDLYLNTLQIIVQAVGRICRCRNKNKNIYIYTDMEVIDRLVLCKESIENILFNDEFLELFKLVDDNDKTKLYDKFTQQTKDSFGYFTHASWNVRKSSVNVKEWIDIRDYVLKNPTTNNPLEKYKKHYFDMQVPCSGYSFKREKFVFTDLKLDTRYDGEQVSEAACDLPVFMSIDFINQMFVNKGYSRSFEKKQYIMNPSLFKQIYMGALGEVIGKEILYQFIGWDIEEIKNVEFYELFDFKLGNMFFDFKHWDNFQKDNDAYVKKIENKLSRVKGAKCFVINIIKRQEAPIKINMGDTVVQVPYLYDPEKKEFNEKAMDYMRLLYEGTKDNN